MKKRQADAVCGVCDNLNGVTRKCRVCGVEFCRVCGDFQDATCIFCREEIMEDELEKAFDAMMENDS